MEIEKYDIKLVKLTYEKIELVRQWRNSEPVCRCMQIQDEITPRMQTEWFASIDNNNNAYFLIYCENEAIGLINLKAINYEQMSAESGIFIAKEPYLNTDVPVRASLCLADWSFDTCNLTQIYITVSRKNHKAIQYNKALGYNLLEGEEEKEFQKYVLTKASYCKHKEQLIELIWN